MDVLHLSTDHLDGDRTVIRLEGELDVATTPMLERHVAELVAEGYHRLVLDLERLDFIDSTGFGALIGAQNRVRALDGGLLLRSVPDRVKMVMAAIGLDSVLTSEPSAQVDGGRLAVG